MAPMNSEKATTSPRDTDELEVEILADDDRDTSGRGIPLPAHEPVHTTLPTYNLPAMPDTLVSADPLTAYLARLRHIQPLSAEDQQILAEAYYEDGNVDAARDLIMSNLRLVVKIAREYHRRRNNLMELVQEGNVGLAEAIRRYDPYRGVKFTSYAQYWIRAMILNYLMNVMQLIKVGNTRSGRKLFYNLRKAREELIQQGYLAPTTLQLAEHLGVPEQEVVAVSQVLDQPALSFDAPAPGHEEGTLDAFVPDPKEETPETIVEELDIRQRIRAAFDAFRATLNDDRQRAIWDDRIASEDPKSLQELGDEFGVSRERVRQIEKVMKDDFKDYWEQEMGGEGALSFLED